MKIGDRVKYITVDSEEYKESGYYPPVGTAGTILYEDEMGFLVKWDSGTIGDGEWWCSYEDVESADSDYDELTDKIAKFFEDDEENWSALMGCWLENGKSDGLRKLLQAAMKM